MGRSWNRYDASLEDIKRCRKAILSQFSNATDIYFDEYLVDTHQNESCNANKFYYGAVLETKDGRFQAATSYGRIGDYNKAFGGIKAFDEGLFTNFDSAKRKLNEKLDKKKRGKRCSKCKTRQSYSPFAPKNAEEYGADYTKGYTDTIQKIQYNDKYGQPKESIVQGLSGYAGNCPSCSKRINFPIDNSGLYCYDCQVYLLPSKGTGMDKTLQYDAETEGWVLYSPRMGRSGVFTTKDDAEKVKNWFMGNAPPHYNIENTMKIVPANANDGELDRRSKQILLVGMRYDAENMSPQVFGKLVGQYPQPPNNPLPVGGFMDEGFEWTVNQAENEDGWFAVSYVSNEKQAKNELRELEERAGDYKGRYEYKIKENPDKKGWSVLARSIFSMESETGLEAITEPEVFGSSNIVSKVKNNWLNGLVGLGLGLVAFDFVKKKGYVANADTLIEGPNTGDLTPADYEEIVVESTGYAVPIIPVSLDGSFMGSRFHALPTDRYVYDSPEGIGAHSDVAMKRNTTFLPNEMSLVQASEAPGQSPYNSILPNGQENKDFPLRVIHETTTVSLDPSTAPFIPTDMSGYTGQQFIPTSVYEDMLGVGISGKIPSFSQPASGDIGSNHFGSRIANPDMLTNVGGPLQEDVNGDYTDGSITKSLSQWSIENQVQQISDTEAIVVERGSGGRKMIRRV